MSTHAAPSDLGEDALELLILSGDGFYSLNRFELIKLSQQKMDPRQQQVVSTYNVSDMSYSSRIYPWPYPCLLIDHGLLVRCRSPQMDVKADVSCLLPHLL
jgi:hypothetical protein